VAGLVVGVVQVVRVPLIEGQPEVEGSFIGHYGVVVVVVSHHWTPSRQTPLADPKQKPRLGINRDGADAGTAGVPLLNRESTGSEPDGLTRKPPVAFDPVFLHRL
jgi:hypothetical protein